jgi:hypothetical protein
MGYYFRVSVLVMVFFYLLTACTNEQSRKYQVTPNSYGKVDNIMLVADDYTWTTSIGDTFRNFFEAFYPVTPQPESIYDIQYKKPKAFKDAKILRTHRAIIILGVLDDQEDYASVLVRKSLGAKNIERARKEKNYRIAIHKDRWATGQIVVYWFAPTRSELLETVARDHQKVMNVFNKADTEKFIEQIYIPGQNLEATKLIENSLDLSIKIPRAYQLAHDDSTAVWLRKETDKISSNIFICSLPLSDSTRPSPEHHKRIRDQLTKNYFSTHIDGSYMQIDDRVLPIYYQPMTFDNKQTLQARGLWGMVNDFMGGSFLSYMIVDDEQQRVLFLDGFVHAPGQKKRPELRKLDMIFSTFKIE